MLTIDPDAGPDVLAELLANLHPDDAAELRAAGVQPQPSDDVTLQALRWHGRLVAVFGLQPHPHAADAGVPWMLCTNVLTEVPRRQMAAISESVVAGWRERCTLMQNMVHRHNARAMRFVRWLGFVIDPMPVGPGGQFNVFTWRRACAMH